MNFKICNPIFVIIFFIFLSHYFLELDYLFFSIFFDRIHDFLNIYCHIFLVNVVDISYMKFIQLGKIFNEGACDIATSGNSRTIFDGKIFHIVIFLINSFNSFYFHLNLVYLVVYSYIVNKANKRNKWNLLISDYINQISFRILNFVKFFILNLSFNLILFNIFL